MFYTHKCSAYGLTQFFQTDEYCVALYAFPGESDGDLVLQPGDRVQVIEHVDDDWLRGVLNGKQGVFPKAFVEMCITTHTATNQESTALVLHDFPAQAEGDLELQQGQTVQVLGEAGDGWLRGRIENREGIFPEAFVQRNS